MSDYTRVHVDAVLASFVTPYAPAPVPGGFMSCDYDVTEEIRLQSRSQYFMIHIAAPWARGSASVSQGRSLAAVWVCAEPESGVQTVYTCHVVNFVFNLAAAARDTLRL